MTYRSLFDERVDRMLLDSVVAPGQMIEHVEDSAAAKQAYSGRSTARKGAEPGPHELTGKDEYSDMLYLFTAVNCSDTEVGRIFEDVWAAQRESRKPTPVSQS